MDYKERLQKLSDNWGLVERTVKKVTDGDTFEVDRAIKGFMRVRIANYDAPEKNEVGYEKATKLLQGLIEGKEVTVDPKTPNYGRIVAKVFYKGTNVADQMRLLMRS